MDRLESMSADGAAAVVDLEKYDSPALVSDPRSSWTVRDVPSGRGDVVHPTDSDDVNRTKDLSRADHVPHWLLDLGPRRGAEARRSPGRRLGNRQVVVFGGGAASERLVRSLEAQSGRKVRVVGVFGERISAGKDQSAASEMDAASEDLLQFAQTRRIDEVIIALPRNRQGRLGELVQKFCALSASITLYEDIGDEESIDRLPSLRRRVLLRGHQNGRLYRFAKPVVDRLLGLLLVVAVSPLMLLVAFLVKSDSPGSALFCQQRYGQNGKVFWLYKFRTLREGATDHLGARQIQVDDDRVTSIGKTLRRTHLDELPQLLNVLKGDMSLVGPRPHPIGMRTEGRLCHELLPYYFSRYRVKPGMTGWAQVNGCRGPTRATFQLRQRVDYDLEYVDHCSFWFDVKILMRTMGIFSRLRARMSQESAVLGSE